MTSPAPRTVIAAKLIADELKAVEMAAKADVLELSEETGGTTFTVKDDDGTKLGTVSKSEGRTSVKVVNEAALYQWVKANRPDQLVKVIAPAYVKSLIALALEHGDAVDETTGEVIPGLEVTTGAPFVAARPTPEAKARMHELFQGSSLLELAGRIGEGQ
jgi:hypothetical protein